MDRFFASSEIERMGHVGDLGIRRSDEVRTKLREGGGDLGDTCHQPRRADWETAGPHNTTASTMKLPGPLPRPGWTKADTRPASRGADHSPGTCAI